MGDVFLELKQHETRIRDIIAAEEASFGKTLVKVRLSNFLVITLNMYKKSGTSNLCHDFHIAK